LEQDFTDHLKTSLLNALPTTKKSKEEQQTTGAVPTIAIYNVSVVKSYNATNSVARF
jgi:hypothetical protein